MKRAAIIIAVAAITIAAVWAAYIERGYFAAGGEWLFLVVAVPWLLHLNDKEKEGVEQCTTTSRKPLKQGEMRQA